MVSTRQMTTGGSHSGNGSGDESTSFGPARFTRSGSGSGDESSGPISSRYTRNNASVAGPSGSTRSVNSSRNLLDLPQEILEKILKNLSFKNVCQVRLVSWLNIQNGFITLSVNIENIKYTWVIIKIEV